MPKNNVGTKKPAMTAQQRKEKLRENNPEYEAHQKATERQRVALLRFHISREYISDIEIPEEVDQTSDLFASVKVAYLEEVSQPVEVV